MISSPHFMEEIAEDEVVIRECKLAQMEFKPANKAIIKNNPSMHDYCISNPAQSIKFPWLSLYKESQP